MGSSVSEALVLLPLALVLFGGLSAAGFTHLVRVTVTEVLERPRWLERRPLACDTCMAFWGSVITLESLALGAWHAAGVYLPCAALVAAGLVPGSTILGLALTRGLRSANPAPAPVDLPSRSEAP